MVKSIVALLFGLVALLVPARLQAEGTPKHDRFRDLCAEHAARAESRREIPRNLLGAIALAESGRWDESTQENIAWPWTVMAEGKGRYLESKSKAIAEVRALQRRGVANIDVGCMQINLMYHGDAFPDLEAAFDPAANADYAARFLIQLHDSAGSWARAAAHYHSRTPDRARAYGRKVAGIWKTLNASAGAASVAPLAPAAPRATREIVDGALDDAAAFAAARQFAAEQVRLAPVDFERSSRLNGRLKETRAATRDTGTQGRDLIAWNDTRLQLLGSPGTTAMADARVMPSPQQRRSDQNATAVEDDFAARRRAQLAAWRRDPGLWRRDPPADSTAPSR